VPAAIAGAGEHATRRFLEFFAATIRNRNTRMTYYRACCSFFAWLSMNGVTELADIEPIHVAAYIWKVETGPRHDQLHPPYYEPRGCARRCGFQPYPPGDDRLVGRGSVRHLPLVAPGRRSLNTGGATPSGSRRFHPACR
jgi:hypothetical protein